MKVRDLIDRLSRLDPDAEVVAPEGEFADLCALSMVGYDPETPGQVVLDFDDWRWRCTHPVQPRLLSDWEVQMQRLTAHAMQSMVESFLKQPHPGLFDAGVNVGHTLRIRMPELPKDEPPIADDSSICK